MAPSLRSTVLVAALAWLALAGAAPVRADDDDSPSSPDASSPGGPNSSDPGGSPGGEGRRGLDLGPNPGTDPLRDFPRFLGALFGTRPPARPPPPPVQGPVRAADELVVLGLSPAARAAAEAAGFRVLASRAPGSETIARLRAPPGITLDAAIARLRAIAPAATVDRNHLYRPSGGAGGGGVQAALIAWPEDGCARTPRLGMVDTGIDARHPALAAASLVRETVRGPGLAASGRAHGTAIAVLLVGQDNGPGRGLLPRASLLAIDAFHATPSGDAADAYDLASAVALLAARQVGVANLSVAGPPNLVLDRAGQQAASGGMLLVAAAGNNGPAATVYPAAYSWAVAVTAVDAQARAYVRAGQGSHIAFAAPGVGVPVKSVQGATQQRTGTSYAVPFVTAALALARAERPGAGSAALVRSLAAGARDLGAPGRDPVFGWGLVQAGGLCGGG
jgi:hypothetical protein